MYHVFTLCVYRYHLWLLRLQVSLRAIVMAVGDVEEVHFVLFGLLTFNAFVDAAVNLFGEPLVEEEEGGEGSSGGEL